MSKIKTNKNERYDLDDAYKGTCENCGSETWVRPVEVFSAISLGRVKASRGFNKLCFKCFGPRIIWKSKQYGDMRSPMNIPYDQLDDFLVDHFKSRNNS